MQKNRRGKSKRDIKDEKARRANLMIGRVMLLAVAAIVLAIVFNFYQGHKEQVKIEGKIALVEEEIVELQVLKGRLEEQIEGVNSLDFIEEIAREELGLVKKGELVYIMIND